MSLKFSVSVRAAEADAIETAVGTSPKLVILTGSAPANCAAAETGTRLAVMTLPSDWLTNPADGTKAISGTWEDTSADNTGTAGYFRIYDSSGSTCHIQGSVTATGGGGDMTLDNTSIAAAQDVKIITFTLTEGNS
jgi:hypothetical protein